MIVSEEMDVPWWFWLFLQQKSADSELSDALASRCKLTDIPEGKIGKLQVMKSGKTRLVLGDVTFDLSRGAPCGFLQVRTPMHCMLDESHDL